MTKKNLFQVIFILITISFLAVNFCLGKKESAVFSFVKQYGPKLAKEAVPYVQSKSLGRGKEKKEKSYITQKKIEKEIEKMDQASKNEDELDFEKEEKKEILEGFLRKSKDIKKIKNDIVKQKEKIEAKKAEIITSGANELEPKQNELKKLEEDLINLENKSNQEREGFRKQKEIIVKEEYLGSLTGEESGGLSGAKKTGLATLATAGIGGLTTGTTSAVAGTLFAGAQALQEDEEGVFLETEEEVIEDETVSGDETTDEETSPEIPVEKAVKKIEKKPEGSIIGELISSAKEVAGEAAEIAAVSMATGTQKEEMIKKIEEEDTEEKTQEKKKLEKEKKKTEAKKQEKKKPTEEKKKIDKKKVKKEKTLRQAQGERAKQEVLKVISLPEDMELTSKQAESLLSILADHANKVLKKSSRLFANDEKEKSFTTISGETISVVGKDFSKEYLDKYQSTLEIYKKARNEYKVLLKKKKSGKEVDEDQLASNKRYYNEMKDKTREAFIEKQTAINSKALYYQPNGKACALKIIQEGVKIIQEHTPEKFDEIDLLKIFPYLKLLDIESKDILPSSKEADKQNDRDIEKELFEEKKQEPAVALPGIKAMAGKQEEVKKRLEKEQRDVETRLSKEQEDIEMLRKKREQEFEAVEERLKKEQEDVEKRRQEVDKELGEWASGY